MGPMLLLADRGVISRNFLGFYAPIAWIAVKSRPIMACPRWYLSLWVDPELPDLPPPESEIPEAVEAP